MFEDIVSTKDGLCKFPTGVDVFIFFRHTL